MEYLLIVFILFIIIGLDMRLRVLRYQLQGDVDLKIVHISDLHGCRYGKEMKTLVDLILKEKPDLLLYTGDIFDDSIKYTNSRILMEKLKGYPSYYVNGNHEHWSQDLHNIYEILEANQVIPLDDETALLTVDKKDILISGIEDPDSKKDLGDQMSKLSLREDAFNILLAHRPENIERYLDYDFDLILSGHAHGGQWRIPYFLNGLFAPNQGIFPKYAGGRYVFKDTNFIVSRGLARESTLVPRFYNRPELVIIEIKNEA